MRALIVGCGYVGLPLGAELVRQGHTVFGLKRSGTNAELRNAGITPLVADLTRLETLTGLPRDFDWVVNCAATGGGDAEAYRRLYLEGNRNLIKWLTSGESSFRESERPLTPSLSPSDGERVAARSGEGKSSAPVAAVRLKKFIYTSSTSVYGQNDGSLVDEADPVSPTTATAQVLVATENLLLAEARSGEAGATASQGGDGSRGRSPRPLPLVILRLAGIYGPGRGHWFKQFVRGEARLDGDGARYLNMVHRDDVVGAIIAALRSETALPSVFNVVDDESVTQRDFFAWLAAQLHKPMPPTVLADAEANRKRGVTNKRVSNRRLKQTLGYQFKYPTFREGYATEVARS